MSGDIALGVGFDEEIEVTRVFVGGNRRIGSHYLFLFAVNGQIGGE